MKEGILVLIALLLGYAQGAKRKRTKEGKKGGIFAMIGERFTRKGRLIKEQEQEIFELKDKVLCLQRQQEIRQNKCFTKGNVVDLEKSLFLFLWEDKDLIEMAKKCHFYLNTLFMNIPALEEEKYTAYGMSESFSKIEGKVKSDYVPPLEQIYGINYSFDYEEIQEGAREFVLRYNNYDFNVTLKEFNNALKNAIEK